MKLWPILALVVLVAACQDSLGYRSDTGGEVEPDALPPGDADGDGIGDEDEGRWDGPADTDGDTVPDWLDEDSDGDTIPDAVEEGDGDPSTPPADSDGDGVPDFRDLDSDGNGVLDRNEGHGDSDGDGIPDHRDLDNDGDGIGDIVEIRGTPAAPPDTDGDAIPDYLDLDSDDDTISDLHESDVDSDSDTLPDYIDLDSDCDTIPDSTEAGDADITTPPVDTDGDGAADFRDPDSDNDGLSDLWEFDHGLDPYSEDSDMDGVPDLIEVAAGTDPLAAPDNPRTRGHFVFIMHYNDPAAPPTLPLDPDPSMDHLVFATDLQMADVFFALDSSSTMASEINNLRDSLRTTVIPGVVAEIPNVWFGIGRFEDCGTCSYSMAVLQELTDTVTDVEYALTGWTTCGGAEPYTQYLYALATGDLSAFLGWGGITPTSWTCTPPGDIGWPCFRTDSVPIIVQFGDEDFSEAMSTCSPGYTRDQAITALGDINARYIGVSSSTGAGSRPDMEIIAIGTGSVDTSGTPLVFDIPPDGSGLGGQVVDAIEILANQVPIEVTTRLRDDRSDLVDTVREFIDYVEPSVVGGYPDPTDPTVICVGGLDVEDRHAPVDGRPDSFTGVLPGTPVCFDIWVKQNWTVPPTTEPQTFLCEIDVIGDSITVLSTRHVYFLVPPTGLDTIDCPD